MPVASQVVTIKVNQKQQKKTTNPYLAHKVAICIDCVMMCKMIAYLNSAEPTELDSLSLTVVLYGRLEGAWKLVRTLPMTHVSWDHLKVLAATAALTL